jgi:hypothetical protein
MGDACSTYCERKVAYRILVGRPEGRNHLKTPGVEGGIILKWIFNLWEGGMDWIDLARERNRWRDLVNVVMNLRVT